jgi:hypothetical protein
MATVSDLNNTTLSGLNHIDALLDIGPDWNYLTPAGNTLLYTFSVTSGSETGRTGQEAFTLAQQSCVRAAFDYISKLTGIVFTETAIGGAAQIHLANLDLAGAGTTGLCSWQASYSYDQGTNELVSYNANAWVYLDNVEWRAENRDLTAGGWGYETLLHELGHALGLKHPFDDNINLPSSQDNTANTLMAYNTLGGPYGHYNQYDVAALKWIYGGDGLRGALGMNSTSGARYIMGTNGDDTLTGTQSNDTLEGDGGNDTLHGGSGTDTAVFLGARSDYDISVLANGGLRVTAIGAPDGSDTLDSVEILQFSNGSYSNADVATAIGTPTAAVASTAGDNHPLFSGTGVAGTTIELLRVSDGTEIGRTTVAADGNWSIASHALPNGDYSVHAVAVDQAGNASTSANTLAFNIASALNSTGGAGADRFAPGAGDNAIDGGAGTDTAVYDSARANYTVSKDVWGYSVVDNSGANGHDSLVNVERVHFSDAWLALDVDGVAGQAFRLYQAAFDRPAEAAGLGYWIWRMENGTSLTEVAKEFMTGQKEFDALYGSNPTDADFVNHLYNNVLHRAAEGSGYDYWMNVLSTHGASRAEVLEYFSESAENQAQVVGSIQDGMTFTPWQA